MKLSSVFDLPHQWTQLSLYSNYFCSTLLFYSKLTHEYHFFFIIFFFSFFGIFYFRFYLFYSLTLCFLSSLVNPSYFCFPPYFFYFTYSSAFYPFFYFYSLSDESYSLLESELLLSSSTFWRVYLSIFT